MHETDIPAGIRINGRQEEGQDRICGNELKRRYEGPDAIVARHQAYVSDDG